MEVHLSIMRLSSPHRWYSLADWNQSHRVGNIKQATRHSTLLYSFTTKNIPFLERLPKKVWTSLPQYFKFHGSHVLAKCCAAPGGIEVWGGWIECGLPKLGAAQESWISPGIPNSKTQTCFSFKARRSNVFAGLWMHATSFWNIYAIIIYQPSQVMQC